MAEIKKFKNGKIKIELEAYDRQQGDEIQDIEYIYHDEMFMKDIRFTTFDGDYYLVDDNTDHVYYFGSYLCQNPLKQLLDELRESGKIYLYPLSENDAIEIGEEDE